MSARITVAEDRRLSFNLDKSLQNTTIGVTVDQPDQPIDITIMNKLTGEQVPTETDPLDSRRVLGHIPAAQVQHHYLVK